MESGSVWNAERRCPRSARLVQPLIQGNGVAFVGEVDDTGKQSLLGDAAALLFPIDWREPFGLVMIEAMACGTPVIAERRRGSVPEIIDDGVTGFIADTEAEAVAAVGRLAELDRKIRATCEPAAWSRCRNRSSIMKVRS
jgi:glycosyltransferase involved in cell wall biosynthesis